MEFDFSPRTRALRERPLACMDERINPNEALFDEQVAEGDQWKAPATAAELAGKNF